MQAAGEGSGDASAGAIMWGVLAGCQRVRRVEALAAREIEKLLEARNRSSPRAESGRGARADGDDARSA
jgi:hypothetical protein